MNLKTIFSLLASFLVLQRGYELRGQICCSCRDSFQNEPLRLLRFLMYMHV
jgi:hypothetical protein